jgi:hypothetical protein
MLLANVYLCGPTFLCKWPSHSWHWERSHRRLFPSGSFTNGFLLLSFPFFSFRLFPVTDTNVRRQGLRDCPIVSTHSATVFPLLPSFSVIRSYCGTCFFLSELATDEKHDVTAVQRSTPIILRDCPQQDETPQTSLGIDKSDKPDKLDLGATWFIRRRERSEQASQLFRWDNP